MKRSAIAPICLLAAILLSAPSGWGQTKPADSETRAGEHVLAATKSVDTYWLPGWGAVPPVRTEHEKALVPAGLGWTQVWHYAAPTFEFAWQYREGQAVETFRWPDVPTGSSLVWKQGSLSFSQNLVVEIAGEEYPLVPASSFEVRSGTDGMDILRITGTANKFDVTLDYFFDEGMPGGIVRVTATNNTEADLQNARFMIRSTARGPWDKLTTIPFPGAEPRTAVRSPNPQKALYFLATSSREKVQATITHSEDVSLYYHVEPGQWQVDATFNLFKLAPGGSIDFNSGIIMLPDHAGVVANEKLLALSLPPFFFDQLPDYYNRGFARAESGIRWTEAALNGAAEAEAPFWRGLSLAPREMNLPLRYSDKDADARMRRPGSVDRELEESGANLVLLGDYAADRKDLLQALEDLSEMEIPERWLVKQETAQVLSQDSEARPTGYGFWLDSPLDVPWAATAHKLKQSEESKFPALGLADLRQQFAGELTALWSSRIDSATDSVAPVVLVPLLHDRQALLGAGATEARAAYQALAKVDGLVLCLAYGGMDLDLLGRSIRDAREAGIDRVVAGLYPEMWNDPAVVLRSLATARKAGACGAVALSLTGDWPRSTSDRNWDAWSVGSRAFFGGGFEEELGEIGHFPALLEALATNQWVIVASPLDIYKSDVERILKTVPNRYLQMLSIAPTRRMRPGSVMVLIGTPSSNLEIADLLKSEKAGFRLQDLKDLEPGEFLIGCGQDSVMITGADQKGVKRGLRVFQEICEILEPEIKPVVAD